MTLTFSKKHSVLCIKTSCEFMILFSRIQFTILKIFVFFKQVWEEEDSNSSDLLNQNLPGVGLWQSVYSKSLQVIFENQPVLKQLI